MSTPVLTTGWTAELPVVAGTVSTYQIVPGTGGAILAQWTDDLVLWRNFTNTAVAVPLTGQIPDTAVAVRAIAFDVAGTIDVVLGQNVNKALVALVAEANLAATSPLIDAGVFLQNPTTGLIYGQSDGAGGYEALGGGGGGGGGGGDDVTAWGGFTGGISGNKPTTVTDNGVTQTIAYISGTDTVESYTIPLIGAAPIVTTLSYDNGYSEASGNIMVGGALTMTAAQAQFLKSEILDGLGVAANGFKARVTDLFYTTATANATAIYRSGVLEWQNTGFLPVSNCKFRVRHQSTHVNNSAESAALSSIVLPRWLCKAGATWKWRTVLLGSSGTAGTFSQRPKVNGSSLATVTSASGATSGGALEVDVVCTTDSSQMYWPAPMMIAGGTATTSAAALLTTAIDTASNDLTLTVTGQTNSVSDRTITHYESTAELVA